MAKNYSKSSKFALKFRKQKPITTQVKQILSFFLLPSILWLSSATAYPKPTPSTPQLPNQTNTPDSNRAAAEKAEAEAKKLDIKTTPITQVIAKYEEVLKYWRLAKERNKEAKTLNKIATLYWGRGEYPKAVEYAQKALPICQALEDHKCEESAIELTGGSYEGMGEYQKAIDNDLQAVSVSPNSPNLRPSALTKIGQIYANHLGETQKALDYYNQALAFWQEKGDVVKQAETLEQIAGFYTHLGEINKSVEIYKQANNLDPEFKRDRTVSDLQYNLLSFSICTDKLASLKKRPQIEPPKNSSNKSATANSHADTYNLIEKSQREAENYRKQGYLNFEASERVFIGDKYKHIGEYPKTLKVYQQALTLRRSMGDKPNEAETLTNIADILNKQGKKQEAINYLNQALEIQRQIKTLPDEADTLDTLGDVYLSLGAYPESLNAHNQALSIWKKIGNHSSEISTLWDIGYVYRKLQNYPQALNYYQQALSTSRTTGNCYYEALSLERISPTYLDSGDDQQAISFANQALDLSWNLEVVEFKSAIKANMLNIRAHVESKQGNYSQALEDSQKARKLAQEIGAREIEGEAYTRIAEAYAALKQPEKAIQSYQEQLALYAQMGLLPEQAQSLYNIAKLQSQNKQLLEALSVIDQAIEKIENIRKEVVSEDLKTSFFATVQDYYQLKINILMELHKQDPSKGYNAQAIETSDRSRARGLVELLTEAHANIRKGANPELLAEENHLQGLIDAKEKLRFEIVNSNKIQDPNYKANADNLQTEINQLLTQQKELEIKIRQSSPKYANLKYPQPLTLPQIQQQLDKDTLLLQYSLGDERSFLWVVSPDSIDTYELPKKQEIEKSAINLFCLISNYSSKPPSATNKENPCAGIKTLRIDLATKELSQLILSPVKDKLGTKRLVVVADGALQYIPFAALADLNSPPISAPQQPKEKPTDISCSQRGGIIPCSSTSPQNFNYQPLLVNHEIVSLPSASAIAIQRQENTTRKAAPKALAILADPVYSPNDTRVTNAQSKQPQKQNSLDLELERSALKRSADSFNYQTWPRLLSTRTEAQTIFKLVPDSTGMELLDFAANYKAATSSLNQFRILHFATHGFVNDANPELSGIVLSLVDQQGKDIRGYLRLADLFNLDYPADLIVLSACETGLGKEIQGEGLVGLTRGLMYAGAERLVVSLWQVSDEGTAEFMQEFYKQMWQQGKPANQALRAAQLKMWQQEKWRNPNYWAAFTFLGEWR
ncbi:TPR repeat-containing protein [Calothrix brevissima NIES-22]|nr:TPR repeat-containing protein [Calothrix brevissima NIES-22]